MDHKRTPPTWIACWYENGVRSDQLENGLRTHLKIVFWKILISIQDLGLKLCSSILIFQGWSITVHGSPWRPHVWRNLWTPKTRKVLKNNLAKMIENTLNLVWNGFRKFNLGHGDLDPAPNFDPDALAMVSDPPKHIFWPQISKMPKNLKRTWIAY